MNYAACGGVTHWALAPDDDDLVLTIAWGQNAANGISTAPVINKVLTYDV